MYGSRLVVPQSGITLCLCMYGSRCVYVWFLLYHNLEYRCVYVWFTSCCTTIWNIAVFMYSSRLVVPQSGMSLCLCMVHVLLYHNLLYQYHCVYVWDHNHVLLYHNLEYRVYVFMYGSLCLCMVLVVPQSGISLCLCMVHVLLYHNLEYRLFMYGSRLVVPQSGMSLCLCMVHVLWYHNLEYHCVYVWFTSCCITIWNITVFMYGSRLVVPQSGISLCLCIVHVLLYHNLEWSLVFMYGSRRLVVSPNLEYHCVYVWFTSRLVV